MANTKKKSTKKNTKKENEKVVNDIVVHIILIFFILFITFSLLGYCGIIGNYIKIGILSLFGTCGYYVPIIVLIPTILNFFGKNKIYKVLLIILFFICLIGIVSVLINGDLYSDDLLNNIKNSINASNAWFSFVKTKYGSGIIIETTNYFLFKVVGKSGSILIYGVILSISGLIAFGIDIIKMVISFFYKLIMFIPNQIAKFNKAREEDVEIEKKNEEIIKEALDKRKKKIEQKKLEKQLSENKKFINDNELNKVLQTKNVKKTTNSNNIIHLFDIEKNDDSIIEKFNKPKKDTTYNTSNIRVNPYDISSHFAYFDKDNNNYLKKDYNNDDYLKNEEKNIIDINQKTNVQIDENKNKLLKELKNKSINEVLSKNKIEPEDIFYTDELEQQFDINKIEENRNKIKTNQETNQNNDNIKNEIKIEKNNSAHSNDQNAIIKNPVKKATKKRVYRFPPLTYLNRTKYDNSVDKTSANEIANLLIATLEQFGVKAKIANITIGPTITRYEIQPELGVRVKKILELQDDIKLAIAATEIRIEAPIPGKSAIGIEVPNKESKPVLLGDIIATKEFKEAKSKLTFAIGKDISGKNVFCNLQSMPHLLVAGSTGSGKSVCINSIIMSIIYKASPDDVRLIMVDPKVVELQVYNSIPHLLIPVVTDPKKAASALSWAVNEMMKRYDLIAESSVRDIDSYNEKIEKENLKHENDYNYEKKEKLPKIVIIIDEFADLMMVASKEVEDSISRIAQLARACGIYLVIATQRPSVNVISGSIKTNIPGKIAFAVSSGVDSRTILDSYGAEKLLGKGDMLYYPSGVPKPIRAQGCYVSDEEINRVVDFVKDPNFSFDENIANSINNINEDKNNNTSIQQNSNEDVLFYKAGKLCIENNKATSGLIQRKLQVGFNRAARILDQLAENGVVSEQDGKKERVILMNINEFDERFKKDE